MPKINVGMSQNPYIRAVLIGVLFVAILLVGNYAFREITHLPGYHRYQPTTPIRTKPVPLPKNPAKLPDEIISALESAGINPKSAVEGGGYFPQFTYLIPTHHPSIDWQNVNASLSETGFKAVIVGTQKEILERVNIIEQSDPINPNQFNEEVALFNLEAWIAAERAGLQSKGVKLPPASYQPRRTGISIQPGTMAEASTSRYDQVAKKEVVYLAIFKISDPALLPLYLAFSDSNSGPTADVHYALLTYVSSVNRAYLMSISVNSIELSIPYRPEDDQAKKTLAEVLFLWAPDQAKGNDLYNPTQHVGTSYPTLLRWD
jgi:hypothetical protein